MFSHLTFRFQIRFQEIALPVESALADIFSPSSNENSSFRLRATEVVDEALSKCYAADIFLDVLAPEFFKLTLQGRYSVLSCIFTAMTG